MKYKKSRKTKHKEESFYEKATKYALSFKRHTEAAIGIVFLTGTLSYACWKGINFYNSYKTPANSVVQSTTTTKSNDYHETIDECLIEEIKRSNKTTETLMQFVLNGRYSGKAETIAQNEAHDKTVQAQDSAKDYTASASTGSKIEQTVKNEKKYSISLNDFNLKIQDGKVTAGEIKIDEEKLKWLYENALKPAYNYTLKPAYNYTLKPIVGLFKKKAKENTEANEEKPSIEKILKDSPEKNDANDKVTDFNESA